MRILFATDEFPWPEHGGYQIRMAQMLDTLSTIGDIDLVVAVGEKRSSKWIPAEAPVARSLVVEHRRVRGGRLSVAVRWVAGRSPKLLLRTDWAEARRDLRGWLQPSYDLAWFSHSTVYLKLGDLVQAPAIVDIDNVNSARLEHQRLAAFSMPPSKHLPSRVTVGHPVKRLSDLIDEQRWKRVDATVAGKAAAVIVCSDVDRRRVGYGNALIIPNGYAIPTEARPRPADSAAPVLLMVGRFAYAPNLDGAYYFVDHIWPHVRRQVPRSQLRLVGRYRSESDVEWLRRQPGVTVVGEVDNMEPELRSATISIVPLRFGGGTRIKILESFAHRIPVVSTSVGREGLDVVDGRHLLVADRPEAFATACVRLLRDPELGNDLATAGHELYVERYTWQAIRPGVAAIAADIARSQAQPARAEVGDSSGSEAERFG